MEVVGKRKTKNPFHCIPAPLSSNKEPRSCWASAHIGQALCPTLGRHLNPTKPTGRSCYYPLYRWGNRLWNEKVFVGHRLANTCPSHNFPTNSVLSRCPQNSLHHYFWACYFLAGLCPQGRLHPGTQKLPRPALPQSHQCLLSWVHDAHPSPQHTQHNSSVTSQLGALLRPRSTATSWHHPTELSRYCGSPATAQLFSHLTQRNRKK